MNTEVKKMVDKMHIELYDNPYTLETDVMVDVRDVMNVLDTMMKWYSVKEYMPFTLQYPKPQLNGNVLTFFEMYLVKGYYNGNVENIGIEYCAYKIPQFSSVVGWHFACPRNFTVTHWKKTYCDE